MSRAIQPSEGSSLSADPPQTASPPMAPPPQTTSETGPDLIPLVEQVTRRLLRQIAIERERRGGGRWP
jgi:hypothetical protein